MQATRYHSAAEILPRVRDLLEREEAAANLPLGLLLRMAGQPEREQEAERQPFYALIEDAGQPVLLTMQTPPHNVILFGAKEETSERREAASEVGVFFLLREGLAVPGVIGPRDVATGFAGAWSRQTGGPWHVQMEQMIYRLDEVDEVALSPGSMIAAREEHLDLLTGWIVAFFSTR